MSTKYKEKLTINDEIFIIDMLLAVVRAIMFICAISFVISLQGCDVNRKPLSKQVSKPALETFIEPEQEALTKSELEVDVKANTATVETRNSTTNTNTAITSSSSSQETSNTNKDVLVENVDKIDELINKEVQINNGVPIYWFIIGSLLIGILIPQPKIIRIFF